MASSADLYDLLAQLYVLSLCEVFEDTKKKKYTLDLKTNYIKCFYCRFSIQSFKDALVCLCTQHTFCSPRCRNEMDKNECSFPILL